MIDFPKIADAPSFNPPPGDWWDLTQPGTWPWWMWALVLGVLVGIALQLYLVFRKERAAYPPAPPLASHVLAMTLLEELRPRAATLSAQELATRVTEIIRTYLHRQFGILARFSTTQEILAQRGDASTPPPAPAIRLFEDLLLRADSLSYSRSEASDVSLIDEAIDTIRTSRDHLRPRVTA